MTTSGKKYRRVRLRTKLQYIEATGAQAHPTNLPRIHHEAAPK